MIRTFTSTAALALALIAGTAQAQVERTSANPTAVISSTATIPPGYKLI